MTMWRIRAGIDDRPGFLALLTASLALKSVNILSVQVHATESGPVDDFLVDAPEELTAAELVEAVLRGRGRNPWVGQADIRGLVDEPTRVLGLAARVAADPAELEPALNALLGTCEIVRRTEEGARQGYRPDGMVLSSPTGGSLLIRRAEPAFTPAEYARAHALVGLAGVGVRTGTPTPDNL
jgi:hypothetical protein